MTELFTAVLTMSLGAGIAALAVLALRAVLRGAGAPRLACYLLWAVVLFRMVCPVPMERAWAVLPDLSRPVERAVSAGQEAPAPAAPTPGERVEYQRVPIPASAPPGTTAFYAIKNPPQQAVSPAPPAGWLAPLSLVWAAGVLALWGWAAFSYLRLKRRLRAAVWSEGGVWESDRVPGPCVLGFFPPKIYLPPGLDGPTRRYVVLHELTHIRRGDPIVKALTFLAVCLHWFNPLLWLAWVLACRDMEGSCDESVLRQSPPEARAAYSAALLSLAAVRPAYIPLAFGETGVGERIRGVLRWRRPVTAVIAVCALLVAGACVVLGATGSPLPGAAPGLAVEVGASDAFYAAPGDTPWEDAPLVSANAAARLRFDAISSTPDAWAVKDYLLDGSEAPPVQTLESERPTASIGIFSLTPHPASSGVGAEVRGIEVACTWRSGVRRLEHRYRFRLLVPARREGIIQPAPVVLAGGQQIPVSAGGGFSDLISDPVHVPYGGQILVSCQCPGAADWTLTRFRLYGDGDIAWEIGREAGVFDADGTAVIRFDVGAADTDLVGVELSCSSGPDHTWQFVFQSDEAPPFPATWAEAAPLLPVPAEWAHQDLAGRNTVTSLTELQDVAGYYYDWLIEPNYGVGWAAFSVGRGVAAADTYVYRTEDLGRTWTEVGHPSGCWYPTCMSFSNDGVHGVLGTGVFDGAPVYATSDGGESWYALDLPLPEAAGVWEAYEAQLGTDPGCLKLRDTGDESARVCLVTRDGGLTWTQDFPVTNPERLGPGPDALPTAFPSGAEWYDIPVRLLADLPEADISLYGLNGELTPWGGLLLRRGEHLDYFDLFYNPGPRLTLADLALGDFDGDGADELAAVVTTGTGTGTSMQNLYVFEPHWEGFTLSAVYDGYDAWDLPQSVFTDLGLPDNYGVGAIISFRGEGDELRASIGVEDTDYPHTLHYVGDLECAVEYDGKRLTLKEFKFITETP